MKYPSAPVYKLWPLEQLFPRFHNLKKSGMWDKPFEELISDEDEPFPFSVANHFYVMLHEKLKMMGDDEIIEFCGEGQEYILANRFLQDGQVVKVSPSLLKKLEDTDVDLKLPAKLLRSSFPFCYLHIPELELEIHHYFQKKNAKVDGIYIIDRVFEPGSPDFQNATALSSASIDQTKPLRVVDFHTVIYSMEDQQIGAFAFNLIIDDEDRPLEDVIENSLKAILRSHIQSSSHSLKNTLTIVNEFLLENMPTFMKILMYMNSSKFRYETVNEEEDLKQSLPRKVHRNKSKLKKKLSKVCNHIVIGPPSNSESNTSENKISSSDPKVKFHIRRGHFREQRFGKGLKDCRTIWIEPTYVGHIHAGFDNKEVILKG